MYPTKETLTGHVGLDKLMQTSLLGIAQKAKQFKKHRFGNLYGLLNSKSLKEAWRSINKKAAVGVDKISAKEFAENLDSNIQEIVDNLKGRNIGQNWFEGYTYQREKTKQDRWEYRP